MVVAGVWQLQVYQRQGAEAAAAPGRRGGGAAVLGGAGRVPGGRRLRADGHDRGTYEAEHQVLVPVAERPDTFRVVTLLRLDNGDALAVVRGVVTDPCRRRRAGRALDQAGVLCRRRRRPRRPAAEIASVRIAAAGPASGPGRWSTVRHAGPGDARAQGLEPAEVALPEGRGRLRNAAYAMQWWLFAAFTVVMSVRIARDVGRRPGPCPCGVTIRRTMRCPIRGCPLPNG